MEDICRFYNGGTEEMEAVLERACRKRAQLWDLPERLLAQMLFTGMTKKADTVFYVYAAQNRVYHVLVQAYFVWKSYRHLAGGEELPAFFVGYLEKYRSEAEFTGEGQILTAAVLLEQFVLEWEQKKPEDDEKRLAQMQELADILCGSGRCFAFFNRLPAEIVLPDALNGCTILECRSELPGEYLVQYELFPGKENSGLLQMRQACEGVYTEPIMLFDGEWASVTYIRRYQGRDEVLTADETVRCGRPYCIPGSRYALLNRVSALLDGGTAEDCGEAVQELSEIRVRERMLEELAKRYRRQGGDSVGRPHDRV